MRFLPRNIAVAFFCASVAFAQPRFQVVGGFERSYGRVPLHVLIRDTLTITNAGSGVLRIIAINPTCGCTAAVIDTNAILSGATAHVYVNIDPPDAMEHVRKSIVFLTNDLSAPSRDVGFSFEILRDIARAPKYFGFSGCQIGKPCSIGVVLRNVSPAPLVVFRQPISVPGLRSLMPDTLRLAPRDSVDYRLELLPKATGLLKGTFSLRTSSPIDSLIEFPVMANVADEKGELR